MRRCASGVRSSCWKPRPSPASPSSQPGSAASTQRLAAATRPKRGGAAPFVDEWVRWGAGLRAGQFLVLGAKTRALLHGRHHVSPEDVRALALPVLRHRVLLNYRAEADGVTVENVIARLLEAVPPI